eukprot:110074_1
MKFTECPPSLVSESEDKSFLDAVEEALEILDQLRPLVANEGQMKTLARSLRKTLRAKLKENVCQSVVNLLQRSPPTESTESDRWYHTFHVVQRLVDYLHDKITDGVQLSKNLADARLETVKRKMRYRVDQLVPNLLAAALDHDSRVSLTKQALHLQDVLQDTAESWWAEHDA